MKILFIAPRYTGGIGGHAKRVSEKLRENGFDVKLMQVPHIPIKKLKNPSFAIFGSLKALFRRVIDPILLRSRKHGTRTGNPSRRDHR